jgi:lysophospholipase L1-like esterase
MAAAQDAGMDTIPVAAGSTLLFEGDSLTAFRVLPHLDTWAWSRLTGATYGYPERVGDWLLCNRPDLRLTLRLGAIAGSVCSDLLERFERLVVPIKPALVVMTIGANDVSRGLAPTLVADQLGEFCQRLDRLCGGRVLHLGGTWPAPAATGLNEAAQAAAALDRGRRLAMATALAARVRQHGGVSVDLVAVLARRLASLRALWDGHTIFHDGTHFNAVGHEIVAGVVLRALGLMTMPGEEPLQPLT